MKTKILLTSFQTWLPHQKSNSSDDLLAAVQELDCFTDVSLFFQRHLSVDIQLASQAVIAKIESVQPDVVVCCGMAEKRSKLTIEAQACSENRSLKTKIDLFKLNQNLSNTEISYDAGKFVCEGLYYQLLRYLLLNDYTNCIFVHVPKLERDNFSLILEDFQRLIIGISSASLSINNND